MDAIRALMAIADGKLPCKGCGSAHTVQVYGDRRSWADPLDGHSYQPMTPASFAQSILAGLTVGT